MNKTLFTLAVVSAFAAGSAFATSTNVHTENFDSRATGAIAGQTGWTSGENDQSEVKEANGGKYLELKTEGDTLTNTLASASVANDAIAGGGTVVFSSEIKFVASDSLDCGIEGGTDDTKFAIYAYQETDSSPANLVVFHGYVDANDNLVHYVNECFTNTVIDTSTFTTVTVTVCRADHFEGGTAADGMFFQVSLNGDAPLETTYEDDYTATFGANWMRTVNGAAGNAGDFSAICLKGTGEVDNISVVAEEQAEQSDDWVDNPTDVAGQTAAQAYPTLASTDLADADAEDLTVWAKANNVDFSTAENSADTLVDAFLLNCDPTDVDDEKDEFVITIEIVDGDVVVNLPEGKTYNGTIQLKGSNDLSTWADIDDTDTDDYKFFKYELSL
jgi:hypothetical protein